MFLLVATALAAKPNVLLIVADDVGVDKLSMYTGDIAGYVPDPDYVPVTPTISNLSTNGVRFTSAWADPLCSPTRSTVLTGKYAYRTGVGYPVGGAAPPLDVAEITLPERLRNFGYTSGLFGKWHLGTEGVDASGAIVTDWTTPGVHVATPNPSRQGFASFYGNHGGVLGDYWDWTAVGAYDYGVVAGAPYAMVTTYVDRYTTELVASEAENFVESANEPWFAMVSFNVAHSEGSSTPYDAEHAEQGCSTITAAADDPEAYRAMIECLDFYTGEIIGAVDAAGRLDNTIVVFMGDNGTESDVGELTYPHAADGKQSAYEAGVRVPLIVAEGKHLSGQRYLPGDRVNRGTSDGLVHVVDLFRTILDFATSPPFLVLAGPDTRSLQPQLTTPATATGKVPYTEWFLDGNADGEFTGDAAIRDLTWKLMVHQEDRAVGGPCQTYELYQISTDRAEATELSASNPADLATMQGILDGRIDAFNATGGVHWLEPSYAGLPVCP